MEVLAKFKAAYDGAVAIWDRAAPVFKKVGPGGAWFAAGFAAAKLVSCLLS